MARRRNSSRSAIKSDVVVWLVDGVSVCVGNQLHSSRLGSPWVTRNSSILFNAPMKKMSLSWVIAMVMRLHRKMGEHMEWQRETDPEDQNQEAAGAIGGGRSGDEERLHQHGEFQTVVICQKASAL